ncbi:phage major capsid protein, P2 family [Mannheimia glucosida]|uniref:phage major capsid protein, P2 family n=1 Tax=Mannheimia glucosida TaxID=85401 RepID=UPI003917ECC1
MNSVAAKLFYALVTNAANFYGADPNLALAGKQYNIETSKAVVLLGNIQSRSDFLEQINVITVKDVEGDLIYGPAEGGITGRKAEGRFRKKVSANGYKYKLAETDSGVLIPWTKISQWGHLSDQFASLYAEYVQRQIALDMIKIGFYGESVADDTTDSNLADVNKGWLQFVRENKPTQILTKGKNEGEIRIFGDEGDYKNLDELAYDLKQGLAEVHRDAGDLVFLVGSDLVGKEASLVYKGNGLIATEKAALNTQDLMKTFGGMKAMLVPNMPPRLAVVTSLKNLSIYTQENSVRRGMKDDDELKAVKDSYWRMEGYVVEDPSKFAAIEFKNVKLLEADGSYK